MFSSFWTILLPLALAAPHSQLHKRLNNGVGRTPAMGFNNWNANMPASAETALTTAQYFISLGLKDVGYEYVNIDDEWSELTRDADGNLQPNATLWPDGIANISAQIHDLGLKFGMYGDSGTETCAGYPGTYGYWIQDANLLASWGVDFWKFDYCFTSTTPNASTTYYEPMRDALNATGREIYFAICTWGDWGPWVWGANFGNSWRIHTDVRDAWAWISATAITAQNISGYAGPGGFNDLDMLETGNGGLSLVEEQTHFTLWAIAKSPLLIGTNLADISADSLSVLKNTEIISINQDPLGIAAAPFQSPGAAEIDYSALYPYWVGQLSDGYVVAMIAVNGTAELSFTFAHLPGFGDGVYAWKELWAGKKGVGHYVTATLENHAVAVYKVTGP